MADVVPDVTGMGFKDALYLLESRGLKVKMRGRGVIKKQSLEPGTKVQRNSLIILDPSS
jgi:cell division protein FtsI (penicillin-binding protein 3)